MKDMFSGATCFNQSIDNFDTAKVTSMDNMFCNAKLFNQSLNNFNTEMVKSMDSMFYNATEFNQSINHFYYNISYKYGIDVLWCSSIQPTHAFTGYL